MNTRATNTRSKDVRTVVVGADGSGNARRALEAAAHVVSDDGTVHVVSAFEPLSARAATAVISRLPAEYRDAYDPFTHVRTILQDAADYLAGQQVRCQTHLADESPAEAVLDLADAVDADLIVVGSRGLGRRERFLHGSISSRIAHHSKRSFMVVRDAPDQVS